MKFRIKLIAKFDSGYIYIHGMEFRSKLIAKFDLVYIYIYTLSEISQLTNCEV